MTVLLRPHRHDVMIALTGLLSGLVLWSLGLDSLGNRAAEVRWVSLLPLAVMAGTELLRRTAPRTATLIGTVTVVADEFISGNLATVLMFTDIMYAAVVYGSPASARRIPVTTGLITIAVTITALAWFRDPQALLIGVVTGLVSFAPATTGAILRNQRDATESARLRAEQTALLSEMDRREAVMAERARMARELHDMVANHLSAIAIHSTAALSIGRPEATDEALNVIRENSVQGLSEMRRLIGLLRDSGAQDEPAAAPTLAGLDALLAQARTSGAAGGQWFTLRDDRPEGAPAPPAPVDLAAYRIVQESLTNALKHAAAGEVLVELAHTAQPFGTGPLTVRVTSPFGDRPGPRAPGSGAGLAGMRERVALLRGEFEAGPVAGPSASRTKQWQVRAVLPLDEERTR
ncbi:histidine kinase [Streptomyces sp. NPDC004647]|uniref:sensor histidine kinase n=1 Tax=Streptomyces sp. NPDC004647 TaxID=3154671 RepID=UPI0033A8387A